jgi:SAM-dependent methyltransferase
VSTDYVHGYSAQEGARLTDQATTLTGLLHADTFYPPGSLVLEAGCGVGAQTVILAANSPRALFTSIDISGESLAAARRQVREAALANVAFQRAGIFDLPFVTACFDHVFVCFVLEHLPDPGVSPRMVYADATRPALADGFTRKTFAAMVEGVGEQAVGQGLMDEASWVAGIKDLYRAAEDDGTFCYTFFKAVGVR